MARLVLASVQLRMSIRLRAHLWKCYPWLTTKAITSVLNMVVPLVDQLCRVTRSQAGNTESMGTHVLDAAMTSTRAITS
jgi:hypothetical protein